MPSGRLIVLDRETCFRKWVELGNLFRVTEWFKSKGIINPHTGKSYSSVAVYYAAMRWVAENADEARECYKKHGWEPDEEVWKGWLAHKIIKCFHSHTRFIIKELYIKNNLIKEYGYLIGETE